jgi:hypothetical protein
MGRYVVMEPLTGLEPGRREPAAFKATVSANSTTGAFAVTTPPSPSRARMSSLRATLYLAMPFEPHPKLITPADDTILWRYMDFARFVQLLENRQLWFSRTDQFEDPLEGTITDGEWLYTPPTADEPPQFRDASGDLLSHMTRNTFFVSCWRMGSAESLAMWGLYGKGSGIVAVTTTVGLLKQQLLPDPRHVFMAQVQYVDWNSPNILSGTFEMVTRKDVSYAHEAEMRAFVWDIGSLSNVLVPERLPVGLAFAIDPQELISEIWIGPREKPWIQPLVERVVARYGLNIPVRFSYKLMTRRPVRPRP